SRRTFPSGTVLIPVVQRDGKGPASNSLQALLRALADTYHVRFFAVQTGLTEQGPIWARATMVRCSNCPAWRC
uniref:hypothetical protein n=1 Tax=Rhodothermus marinus TaxID=29549 RepID=UPI000A618C41